MCELKNSDGRKYRGGLSVYACHSDVTHPMVLQLATQSGVITESRYEELMSVEEGVEKVLTPEELSLVLENFFGFHQGTYEEFHIEGWQKTRFKKKVIGEVRYTGAERTDLDWIETGLASSEAVEKAKFGSVVRMEDRVGCGELVVEDALNSQKTNNEY